MARLLLVEDDAQLRQALRIALTARRFEVDEATSATEALAKVAATSPDLMLLDLGLPDMDGLAMINRIRTNSRMPPIIVLSARDNPTDKVTALESGADDYVTKPFDPEELVARIRVVMRRSAASAGPRLVTTPEFSLDLDAMVATRDGTEVALTPTEWRIADVLVRQPGTMVASDRLLREVWGPQYVTQTHYLRVYLGQLRRKLEAEPSNPQHFITVKGLGYRFQP